MNAIVYLDDLPDVPFLDDDDAFYTRAGMHAHNRHGEPTRCPDCGDVARTRWYDAVAEGWYWCCEECFSGTYVEGQP